MYMYIRFFVFFLVLICLFSMSAFASDFSNDNFIDLLEFSLPNNGNSTLVHLQNTTERIRFYLPNSYDVYYLDFIVRAGTSFTCNWVTKSSVPLTVLPIGSGLYRVYGSFASGDYDSMIALDFNVPSLTFIDFLKFEFSSCAFNHFSDIGRLQVSIDGSSYTKSMPGLRQSATISQDLFDPDYDVLYEGTPFFGYIYLDPWQKYDFIDIRLSISSFQTTGFSAFVKDIALPLDIQYIDSSGSVIFPVSEQSSGMGVIPSQSMGTEFSEEITTDYFYSVPNTAKQILARIDLRGIPRDIGYTPVLAFSGTSGNDVFSVTLSDFSGSVVVESPSSLSLWLSTLLERQTAMHNDQLQFYIDNLNAIQLLTDTVGLGLGTIHTDMVNWFSLVRTSIDSGFSSTITSLSSFRSSMESYMEHLPKRIAEEIAKIFKPTEGKFEAAKDESQELAEEKLGAVYQSAVVIDQIAGAFTVQTPQTSIVIPLVSVEVLPGVPFEFGGWDVPIVPSGLEFLIDTLKYVIDIVCTLAFLNGMKRRLDGFFGGESGVD